MAAGTAAKLSAPLRIQRPNRLARSTQRLAQASLPAAANHRPLIRAASSRFHLSVAPPDRQARAFEFISVGLRGRPSGDSLSRQARAAASLTEVRLSPRPLAAERVATTPAPAWTGLAKTDPTLCIPLGAIQPGHPLKGGRPRASLPRDPPGRLETWRSSCTHTHSHEVIVLTWPRPAPTC